MSLAAKLPFRHPYAAGFPGLGSQPMPTDADALDYLDRMAAADGASVEVGVATAVDAFFRDTKAAGVFSALKACCILAGARTLAGALVPVVGDAPTNVADAFVENDYSRTNGLTGDGLTTHLDSGRASDADPQNDSHWSVYPTALGTPAKALIHTDYTAANEDVSGFVFNQAPNTSVLRSRIGQVTGTPQALVATYEPSNLIAASRASGTEFQRRYNGISEPVTASSTTPQALNYFVFARQNGAGVELLSDATLAFYSVGSSLGTDPADGLADLDTAVTNLINRLKFALLVGENPSGLDPDTIDYIVRGYEAGGSLE
jgi:hypothetical protein